MAEDLRFEQLLYSWSESNLYGMRGFGVVAASDGWLELIKGGDGMLGPAVAYPEAGRGGAQPPAHGGFAVLRGTPVVFRRLPYGTDALGRSGNYIVQILMGVDTPVDADLAAGLLSGDWLGSPLPDGPRLAQLVLPKPGPRRGTANSSALICGALLQGLRDRRRLVIATDEEPAGRAALTDAVRRLPASLAAELTFSTLESEPDRSPFDVAVAVAGWEGEVLQRGGLHVDLSSGTANVDQECRRWGELLAGATAASLRGIPEPVTASALGLRLDALTVLREDPRRLTAHELLSVLTSAEGQEWAANPEAVGVARSIVAGMDPALGPQFAKAAARRPAVSKLLERVGWDVVSGQSGVSTRKAAETMLLGLGAEQGEIDMAVLSAEPERPLPPHESARLLRLLAQRGARLSKAAASKVTWDAALAQEFPRLWFEAVVTAAPYEGPKADRAILGALTARDAGGVFAQTNAAGDAKLARRLWTVLPSTRKDQVAYLQLIASSGPVGLGVVTEHLLGQSALSDDVRRDVLEPLWPHLVREMQLPPYLAQALQPAGGMSDAAKAGAALAGLALLAAIIWGAWLLIAPSDSAPAAPSPSPTATALAWGGGVLLE